MNQILKAVCVIIIFVTPLFSQVEDFTTTDLDGKKHNLYTYLNAGKHVVVTFLFDG